MTDYSHLLIKDFGLWGVYVHENQGYLGRCVVWCNREDALDLVDATVQEQEQLFVILQKLRKASIEVFNPDWLNYAFLGNETRHLHGHFIPRYKRDVEYEGVVFKDELWGHNYKTNKSFVTPPEVLEKIKLQMKETLG